MTETYLPVKESLGYKNVKQALWNVFSKNLDNILVDEKLFESFSFIFQYKGYKMTMTISDTEKRVQFQAGEGGIFDIWFPNPKDELFGVTFLSDLVQDKMIRNRIRRVLGRDEKEIEFAMQVLKDYIDKKYEEEYSLD